MTSEAAKPARSFRYWQWRMLFATLVGYMAFYFVRKNLSAAMPGMEADGITKTQLGFFLSAHGIIYGLSKFLNGFLADRINARVFMVTGLVLSALCNVFFGLGSAVMVLGIAWMANGWAQGMGFPPCARVMSHWFPPEQLTSKMTIWNTSTSIGAGLTTVGCGYVIDHFGWRAGFLAPAFLAFAVSLLLWALLRDSPSSVGLPELGETEKKAAKKRQSVGEFLDFARRRVFSNPYVWLISGATFFIYIIRFSFLDWGIVMLMESRGFTFKQAFWTVSAFEGVGVLGMLVAGQMTDRLFGSRPARVCLIYMAMATITALCFWKLEFAPGWVSVLLFCLMGFAIYGPQALTGPAVANLATKQVAATAIGLTALFAYGSTVLSGWGLAKLLKACNNDWNVVFLALVIVGITGVLTFAFAWRAKAHGYDEVEKTKN